MAGSNRFANVSHSRVREARLSHDEYETPDNVTELLLDHFTFSGPVLEPCCGSGRIMRVLQARSYVVRGVDWRTSPGYDYLEQDGVWQGDVITNPPCHGGLAEAFVAHALAKSTGDVAMLLQSGFLFGQKRANEIFADLPPTDVLIVPWRIRFHIGYKPEVIKSQAYNHVWVIWRRAVIGNPRIHFPLAEYRRSPHLGAMGIFDDISKGLRGEPVAPPPVATSGNGSGTGPTQADVDEQWRKDNPPKAGDLIDALHPVGGK